MARHKHYCQCHLERPVEGGQGSMVMVSWIPSHLAQVGLVVNLKNDEGEWTNGWKVTYAGPKRDGDDIEARSREWLYHRGVTDV